MPAENASTTTDPLALLRLPAYNTLGEAQARGAACVWCALDLTTETAVDLGERKHRRLDGHFSTFPRACRRCIHDAAYKALIEHAPCCEQCVDNPAGCDTAVVLRHVMREHR